MERHAAPRWTIAGLIGLVASLIAIFSFTSGRFTLSEVFGHGPLRSSPIPPLPATDPGFTEMQQRFFAGDRSPELDSLFKNGSQRGLPVYLMLYHESPSNDCDDPKARGRLLQKDGHLQLRGGAFLISTDDGTYSKTLDLDEWHVEKLSAASTDAQSLAFSNDQVCYSLTLTGAWHGLVKKMLDS
jgi:hypothetical protein